LHHLSRNLLSIIYIIILFTHDHLSNTNVYLPLNFDPTQHITYDVNTLIDFLHTRQHIDDTIKTFLSPPQLCRTPIFYGLPKIHKQGTSLRPIVSGFNSLTDNLSKFITHFIQSLATKIPSYIRDTKYLLNILYSLYEIPPNTYLVTADVTSLYTNIPHDEGIEATPFYLNHFRDDLPIYAPNTNVFRIILQLSLTTAPSDFKTTTTYKNWGLRWEEDMHPHTQIYSWNALKTTYSLPGTSNYLYGNHSSTTFFYISWLFARTYLINYLYEQSPSNDYIHIWDIIIHDYTIFRYPNIYRPKQTHQNQIIQKTHWSFISTPLPF